MTHKNTTRSNENRHECMSPYANRLNQDNLIFKIFKCFNTQQ